MTPIRGKKSNSHHDELPQIQAAMLQEVNTALEHLRREAYVWLVDRKGGVLMEIDICCFHPNKEAVCFVATSRKQITKML